jgi:2'-5' RNA ligase
MRLFVAYSGVSEWITVQQQARNFNSTPDIRWTHSYNLHLTLYFIGEVPESALPEIVSAITQVTTKAHSFVLSPLGVVAAIHSASPSMIWLRYAESDEFTRLNVQLYEAISRFIPSAPVVPVPLPHVTLARMKAGKVKYAEVHLTESPAPLQIGEAVLCQTTHDENGVRYRELATFEFGKNQSASATTS